MDATDGQVPTPRRPAPWTRRPATPSGPTELPFASSRPTGSPDEPRVADLSALLADIDSLRLTLQTDLTLAAAALDAGADDLAGELVDGDLTALRAFAARADARLASLEAGEPGADETAEETAGEQPVAVPVRRRRVLSAAPLLAAAAALLGFVVFVPERVASTPDTTMTSAAMAGYELSRLASEGAPDEELRLAAEELNDELAALIAQAKTDPAAAQQALLLLDTTTSVLASQGDSGVLRSVMAEARALRARLRETLPAVAAPRPRPVRPAARPVLPVLPRVESSEERRMRSDEPSSSPKPTAAPRPTAEPTTTATPAPTTQPTPAPAPSESSDGPLPGAPTAGDSGLPGF